MRNPHRSVRDMPRARSFGLMVAELLDKAIELWPELVEPALSILREDEASELPDDLIDKVRRSFRGEAERPRTAKANTPLSHRS